jgi:translation initiation factor 1|tara:strand:- start:430 stop:738 length:309 start_codon:yes stop_codon:yes gene_type:complete
MAVICNTCGLPDDLCACGDLDKDSSQIIIRLETRRFKKKGTMIEGLDPKINNLESVAKELKGKYACGGTAKEGYIFLQGDHRDTIKEALVDLGFSEEKIELH